MPKGVYPHSPELIAIATANMRPYSPGPSHPIWNGGTSDEYFRFHQANRYRFTQWSKAVRAAQDNTCQECGIKDAPRMSAHHIQSVMEYPELAFDVTNGICYCSSCHTKLHWRLAKERNN